MIGDRCGFPDNIIDRIIERLNNEKLSYIIIYKDQDPIKKDFKFNTYAEQYKKAVKKMEVSKLFVSIEEKIKEADIDHLERIMELINEELR